MWEERIKRFINLEPVNIIKMKLLIDKAEINLMMGDKMRSLDDIETKLMIKERWVVINRVWKNLEEFEINRLEIKVSAEIEISIDEENKIINKIDCLKKSKSELLDLYAKKKRDIDYCKKLGCEYENYISIKR